ncbi:hypothetical protein SAMN05216299_10562 [Nitrosospira sp. Nsp14]|nr:hypothetical protein SAMN05216299_10562 [Nitrosospira sp. Nsp14]
MQPLKIAQMMLRTLIPAIIAAASMIAAPSFAQEAASTAESPAVSPSLPAIQLQGQTEFVTGGVGQDESEAMKKEGRAWPLMLEFAQTSDGRAQYLSDVQVTIKDKSGNTVLDATAEGPYMLIRLAPGRYSLDAIYESVTLHRHLKLEKGQNRKVVLVWPSQLREGQGQGQRNPE